MDTLLHRLGEKIKGCIEGFDRIVFKGTIRPIAYAYRNADFFTLSECTEQKL